jgi:hypothetical protein
MNAFQLNLVFKKTYEIILGIVKFNLKFGNAVAPQYLFLLLSEK